MKAQETIAPYGGRLINRFVEDADERRRLSARALELEPVRLLSWQVSDLELIATGGFSPLEGFMDGETYRSVVASSRLPGGLPWTIPITVAVTSAQAGKIGRGAEVALVRDDGMPVALMNVEDVYRPDKMAEVRKVFRTDDRAHPGVARVLDEAGDVYIGGAVRVFERPMRVQFPAHHRDPAEVRRLFAEMGWRTVVAFQTRNPIHRAHEYLQKCALEMVDGLLVHPIVGDTKSDDIPADVRMRCYEALIDGYYPKNRVLLTVLPMAMRYAGPMEAIHHCIVRRNYGATHFIVGRDHAGVGTYYGSFDAHTIFDEFNVAALGITPIFFDHAFYCRRCGSMASGKTCPHAAADRVILSGTKVREMLSNGREPPPEFTRAEVAAILIEAYRAAKGT
jgi:sulfate adenylyltransferase